MARRITSCVLIARSAAGLGYKPCSMALLLSKSVQPAPCSAEATRSLATRGGHLTCSQYRPMQGYVNPRHPVFIDRIPGAPELAFFEGPPQGQPLFRHRSGLHPLTRGPGVSVRGMRRSILWKQGRQSLVLFRDVTQGETGTKDL